MMIASTVLSVAFVVLVICHVGVHVISAQTEPVCNPTCQNTGTCVTDGTGVKCSCSTTSHTGIDCTTACTDPQCTTCDENETNCTACFLEYYPTAAGTCVACGDNCLTCNNVTDCITCNIGYYPDGAGGCTQCSSGCVDCESDIKCLVCDDFNVYLDEDTGTCESCEANCARCNNVTCLVCKTGFYLDADSTCQPCGPFCSECTSATTCTRCVTSRYPDSVGTCQPCGRFCNDCTNLKNCSNCKEGSRRIVFDSRRAYCTAPKNKCLNRSFYLAHRKKCFSFLCIRSRQMYLAHRGKCDRWLCSQKWFQQTNAQQCQIRRQNGFARIPTAFRRFGINT